MTEAEVLRERLRSALKLLEVADHQAIDAKRRVEQIFDFDAGTGDDLILLPCRFEVDGHTYHACVTPEQRDVIQHAAANGTIKDVLDVLIDDIFCKHVYTAAQLAETILLMGLRNERLPLLLDPRHLGSVKHLDRLTVPMAVGSTGACQFSSGCKEPFGKALCISQGGTYVASCYGDGDEDDDEDAADQP